MPSMNKSSTARLHTVVSTLCSLQEALQGRCKDWRGRLLGKCKFLDGEYREADDEAIVQRLAGRFDRNRPERSRTGGCR
ncbi:hypothetical protein BN873_10078 [Candidatus Competibacter denitrificans Run_A_D11]|uniref:Uncharacterized protein n=1 Tax=Candidatus Competibacter denitrificans Run_A_D11 TaxID=1400863 RepID=W6M077_9GAMM|nr:hypothetical protein BN873_10078 [Candidatus Competibacter denitrificans Run_A_D11]